MDKKWLDKVRIVDLSYTLHPGKERRRLEIRSFAYGPGETMHDIDTMSHIGTHVEVPSHFIDACYGLKGKDLSQIPIKSFLGEAIFINQADKGVRQPITVEDLKQEGVDEGDIVLIGNSPYPRGEKPYLPAEAVRWLAEKKIKMIGFDTTVGIEEPRTTGEKRKLKDMATHDNMLKNDIPIIEVLTNMGELRKKRFFFIALPVSVVGLDSFPIRALAFEEID